MKAILAEAEELQAGGRIHHPAVAWGSSISMHRKRSGGHGSFASTLQDAGCAAFGLS
jgi:hypothetical protein